MIYKYNLVKPITNRNKPFIDDKGYFIVPRIKRNYRYYIEASRYNTNNNTTEFYLLLGVFKFDEQCRKCRVDDYCRLKLLTHDSFKDYIVSEVKSRGNVDMEYMESEDNYDVYIIK